MLNIHHGRLYLIGVPPTAREENEWGRPNPGYVQFQFDGGEWKRIEFADVPESIYGAKLVINMVLKEPTSLLTLGEKTKLNNHFLTPTFLQRIDPKHTD